MKDDEKPFRGRGELHQGASNTAPYPVSRLAPAFDLVDLAEQVARADDMLSVTATAQLKGIARQIRQLQEHAREVLEKTQRDQELHKATCGFKRIPGRVYHLYRRAGGDALFSMLSPEEWGGKPPYHYEGSFRLENDMSWTPADELQQPDADAEQVRALIEQAGLAK